MKKPTSTDISQSVMAQIKSGNVRMKPRMYFGLLGVVSVLTIVLAGISVAYLSSILFFWLRVQTADTMAWGARANLSQSIAEFPWWALVAATALLALAVMLVRRHGLMYRHKTSTIALILVVSSLLLGLGLSYLNVGSSHSPKRVDSTQRTPGPGWQRQQQ
jgi:hypothetical protein